MILMPQSFQPRFTLNDVTVVLPDRTNPINYPGHFTTSQDGEPLFFVRSRYSETWVPYEHGELREIIPLCKMAMEKEVVVA